LLKPPEKPPLGKGKERKAGGCRCGNATACPGMPFKTINFKKNWPWIRQWPICVNRECNVFKTERGPILAAAIGPLACPSRSAGPRKCLNLT